MNKFTKLEKVTRDGASVYRNAITNSRKTIKQITDKFHLIKNLIDALKSDLKIKYKKNIVYKETNYDVSNYKINLSLEEKRRLELVNAKQEYIEAIRAEREKGYSLNYIADKYGIEYRTVKKYLETDAYQWRVHRSVELDNYSSLIYECVKNNLNTHQIYATIKHIGYSSSYENFFKQFKLRIITLSLGNTYQLPVYKFSKLLYKNDIERLKLNDENKKYLLEYLNEKNDASLALTIIKEFREIFESKNISKLNEWIEKYNNLDKYINLQTFIKGITRDKEAVENQIESELTNGLIEGKVGKLKAIKRRTYGRASFELLKCLVLLSDAQYFE